MAWLKYRPEDDVSNEVMAEAARRISGGSSFVEVMCAFNYPALAMRSFGGFAARFKDDRVSFCAPGNPGFCAFIASVYRNYKAGAPFLGSGIVCLLDELADRQAMYFAAPVEMTSEQLAI